MGQRYDGDQVGRLERNERQTTEKEVMSPGIMRSSRFPTNPGETKPCEYCGERPAEVTMRAGVKRADVCRSCVGTVRENGIPVR